MAGRHGEEAVGVARVRPPEHQDVVATLEKDVHRERDAETLLWGVHQLLAISTQESNHRS